MPPMIKNNKHKAYCFFGYSIFGVQQCTRTPVINHNIKNDDQEALAPSVQIFADQFKCKTRKKFRIFALKVATSGIRLIFL